MKEKNIPDLYRWGNKKGSQRQKSKDVKEARGKWKKQYKKNNYQLKLLHHPLYTAVFFLSTLWLLSRPISQILVHRQRTPNTEPPTTACKSLYKSTQEFRPIEDEEEPSLLPPVRDWKYLQLPKSFLHLSVAYYREKDVFLSRVSEGLAYWNSSIISCNPTD